MAAPELTPGLEARIAQYDTKARYANPANPVDELAAELQLDVPAFRQLARHHGWSRKQPKNAPSLRALRIEAIDHPTRARRRRKRMAATAANIETLVEQQLSAIDGILQDLRGAEASESERHARTIASVSRTLKELLRLRAQEAPSATKDDDDMPTDIDEFRRDLARRIAAFIASEDDRAVADAGGTTEA